MWQQFGNVVIAFQAHPVLLGLLFLGCFLGAIALFSGGQLGAALDGIRRIFGGLFTAPFLFLRKVIRQAIAYREDSAREAASRSFLLWTSLQVAYVLVFMAAMALAAAGVVVAAAGVWPSAQLAERRALKASEQEADSTLAALQARLDSLKGANVAEQGRQRDARLAALQATIDSAAALNEVLTDSMNQHNTAKQAFMEDVWQQVSDSNFAGARAFITARTEAFVEARTEELPEADLAQVRRFIRGRITLAVAREEQEALQASPDPAAEERTLREQVTAEEGRKEELRRQRGALRYFDGVKAFGVTLLVTCLYLLAFVWVAGTAVEGAALFVGMARDLAALRARGRLEE